MLARCAKVALISLAAVLLLMHLVSHVWSFYTGIDPSYQGPLPRDETLLQYYDYPEQPIDAEIRETHRTRSYAVKAVRFPPATNFLGTGPLDIEFDFYEHPVGKRPAILLIPAAGGIEFDNTTRLFAALFALSGYNCAVVHSRKIDLERIESGDYVESFLRQAIVDHRRVLDYLELQDTVDPTRIGSFGLSLGGIEAVVTAGVDARLKCNVIALAGGSIADILCCSSSSMFAEPRERILAEGNATLDELHHELASIRSDPLALAPYIDARNVLMITALFDRTIPKECSTELRRTMGNPQVFYTLTTHRGAAVYIVYSYLRALGFFNNAFATAKPGEDAS